MAADCLFLTVVHWTSDNGEEHKCSHYYVYLCYVNPFRMKKFGIAILILAVIAAVCIITCPDTQSHKETLIPMITNVWNQQDNDKADARIKEIDKDYEEYMKRPKPKPGPNSIDTGLGLNENGPKKAAEAQKKLVELFRSTPVGYNTIEDFIDNNFMVKNYFIVSIGQIRIDKGYENISLGVFGHVFTISEEEFRIIFDVIHK